MTDFEAIQDVIDRANKAGAKGLRVIGYTQNRSATLDNQYLLIVETPVPRNAGELPWYER